MSDPSSGSADRTLRGQVRRLLALHGLSWVRRRCWSPLIILAGLADWAIHLDALVRLVAARRRSSALGALGRLPLRPPAPGRPVPRPGHRPADRGALAGPERPAGQHDPVPPARRRDDDRLRLGRPARGDGPRRPWRRRGDRLPPGHRAPAGAPALGLAVVRRCCVALARPGDRPGPEPIALRRLFLPFGPDRWPQQTHLALLDTGDPAQGRAGRPVHARRRGRQGGARARLGAGDLPLRRRRDETESLRSVEGGIFRGRIEAVMRPFTFSVAAGDDTTSIRDVAVAVVPPPALKDLRPSRLIAPQYTGAAAADARRRPDAGPGGRGDPGRTRRPPANKPIADGGAPPGRVARRRRGRVRGRPDPAEDGVHRQGVGPVLVRAAATPRGSATARRPATRSAPCATRPPAS